MMKAKNPTAIKIRTMVVKRRCTTKHNISPAYTATNDYKSSPSSGDK